MKKIEDQENDALAKEHADSFKQLSEIEGLIIRGHILVERAIIRAIELSILEKEEFKSDRFTFSQKVIISHMLGNSTSFRAEINALNKLRNQIAHTLAYEEKYIDLIISEVHKKDPTAIDLKKSKFENLTAAISFICGAVSVSQTNVNQRAFFEQLQQTLKPNKKYGS